MIYALIVTQTFVVKCLTTTIQITVASAVVGQIVVMDNLSKIHIQRDYIAMNRVCRMFIAILEEKDKGGGLDG